MAVLGVGVHILERLEGLVALCSELGGVGGSKEGTVEHRDWLQRWRGGSYREGIAVGRRCLQPLRGTVEHLD